MIFTKRNWGIRIALRLATALSCFLVLALAPGAYNLMAAATSSCDQATLVLKVNQGGTVLFNCDGIITLTNTLVIATNTEINGTGHTITISGNNAVRLFQVKPGVQLTIRALTLSAGTHQGTNGK